MDNIITCSIYTYDDNKSHETSLKNIYNNASTNKIELYKNAKKIEKLESYDYIATKIEKDQSCLLYGCFDNAPFNLTIQANELTIEALEPYTKKTAIDCPQPTLNLSFYIEIMLKLVEDFGIWELHSQKK